MFRYMTPSPLRPLRQPLARFLAPVGLGLVLHSAPVQASGFLDPGPFNKNSWSSVPSLDTCPAEDPASCFQFSSNTSMFIASAPSTTTTFTSGQTPPEEQDVMVSFTYSFEPANPFQSASYTVGAQTFPLPVSNGTPLVFWLNPGDQLAFNIYSEDSADPAFLSITNFSSVPAPLPVLGGAVAFGWIRRRRAFLRNSSIAKGACKR